FSTKFKYFFVPLVVAYTYFIVVVSMNYVRQSVSISLIFLGIAFLLNKNNIKFIICLFLASLFHKTAAVFVVLLPLFYITKIYFSKIVSLIYILFSLIFITFILYLSSISESNIYVSQGEISSAGAVFRSMFHVVPVFLYIYFRNFFKKQYSDSILILDYILLLVVYCFVLSFLFSTLSDRFNLYLIFFDILVYAKLCEKLSLFARNLIFLYLFLFYSVVFYIWFNWGEWAEYGWLPYKNYIYEFLLNTF
ncbi:MAG: EpsG family protein, partial [Acinetobacter sp.]|nr:EpsG family protein [Acinetobacter sp.]